MLWSIVGWALIAIGLVAGVRSLFEPVRGKTAVEWISGIGAGLLIAGLGWLLLPSQTHTQTASVPTPASAESEPSLDPNKQVKYFLKKGSLIAVTRLDMETCFQHQMNNDVDAIKDMNKDGKVMQVKDDDVRVFVTQYDKELAGHGFTRVKIIGATGEVWCSGDSLEKRN